MSFTAPYNAKNFMGEHANDAACLIYIQANLWDSDGDGGGNPQEGMLYFNTSTHELNVYASNYWNAFRTTDLIPIGDLQTAIVSNEPFAKGESSDPDTPDMKIVVAPPFLYDSDNEPLGYRLPYKSGETEPTESLFEVAPILFDVSDGSVNDIDNTDLATTPTDTYQWKQDSDSFPVQSEYRGIGILRKNDTTGVIRAKVSQTNESEPVIYEVSSSWKASSSANTKGRLGSNAMQALGGAFTFGNIDEMWIDWLTVGKEYYLEIYAHNGILPTGDALWVSDPFYPGDGEHGSGTIVNVAQICRDDNGNNSTRPVNGAGDPLVIDENDSFVVVLRCSNCSSSGCQYYEFYGNTTAWGDATDFGQTNAGKYYIYEAGVWTALSNNTGYIPSLKLTGNGALLYPDPDSGCSTVALIASPNNNICNNYDGDTTTKLIRKSYKDLSNETSTPVADEAYWACIPSGELSNVQDLADDAEIDLPIGVYGWGFVMAGDGEEYAHFTFTSAGVVTLGDTSTNVANTDSDTDLCIYDDGDHVAIKNRLGSEKTIYYKVQCN